MVASSTQEASKKGPHRSRITNGSALLPGIDGRSVWARRLRDVIEALTADIGADLDLSEAQRSTIRRAACLTVELERLETTFAETGAADAAALDLYARVAANLRRLFESLGLNRPVRDTPRFTEPNSLSEFDLARRVAFAMTMASRQSPILDLEANT